MRERHCFNSLSAPFFFLLVHALYVCIDQWGLFHKASPVLRETLHSFPSLALAALEGLAAFIGLIARLRKRNDQVSGIALVLLSVILVAAGLWASALTRFEGKTVKAEGASFTAFESEYVPTSLYQAKFGRSPEVGLTLLRLYGENGADIHSIADLRADILHSGRWSRRIGERQLGSGFPLYEDWTYVTITGLGYAPRYELRDLKGRILESHPAYLKLYPPGKEDSFELIFLGYVFSLRCYPDYNGSDQAPGSMSSLLRNPVYSLRIVRHKDIVYNGLITPDERLRFDNYVISFPEVKMWLEISFVRDLGLPVIALGFMMTLAGLIVMYLRKERF